MNIAMLRTRTARWPGLALVALALYASGVAEAQDGLGGPLTPAQQYALALEAQTQGDHGAMLTWLRAAARADHPPAQRMLGMVLIGGPALYGPSLPADLCEGRAWLLRAARQNEGPSQDVAFALFGRPKDALTAHCEHA